MHTIHYEYLRPKKAEHLQQLHDACVYKRDDLNVWVGTNATILPLKKLPGDTLLFGRGGVVDCNGNYIPSSAIDLRVQHAYDFDKQATVYVDKKVVYCGYLVNHWGHFLIEAVARLWYFLKNDPTIDKYVFFVEDSSPRLPQHNFKEFLELLGVFDKTEIINTPTTYREVIVPELGYKWRDYYSEDYLNIFETIASNVQVNPAWNSYNKIFFSRSSFSKASNMEFGLEVIDNFFSNNGYTILFPEKIRLSEMIYHIRNANSCASFSGSLPHNMLFAKQEQSLIIIERCVFNNEIQVDVNVMKELNTTYIDGNISLYTINFSGPFNMGYTEQLKCFAENNGFIPPDSRLCSSHYQNKQFKKFMKAYHAAYRYRWYMEDWYVSSIDYLWEAYKDGYTMFEDYLSGKKPFLFSHYFQWHYFKQFIKRVLKR